MAKPREVAEKVLTNDDYLKKILDKIEDGDKDAVLSRLGERIMARDDYSRAQDELRSKEQAALAYKASLDNWYQGNVSELEELNKLREQIKGGQQPPQSDALKSLEGYVKKDEIDKMISQQLRQSEETGLQVATRLNRLSSQHLHEYGKVLDPDLLIAHARKLGQPLEVAYLDITTEDRTSREKEKDDKRIAKLKEEWKSEFAKEQGHGVFPTPTGVSAGDSPLSGLTGDGKSGTSGRIAGAIEDYFQNSANRRAS